MRRVLMMAIVTALTVFAAVPATAAPVRQHADVFTFADVVDVGTARLSRTDAGIATAARITGAPAGDTYTLWWVVWNTPEGCETAYACLEPDLFNPDAGLAIGYAAGGVAGEDGTLRLNARLRQGETLYGFPTAEFGSVGVQLTETTLVDAARAEVHLVVRHHGPAQPGLVDSMLSTFNGGCEYTGVLDGAPPVYGTPGPNACEDVYFAIFLSPTG